MCAGYARHPARMAEWQTLMAQTHLPERACGFDSRSGHAVGGRGLSGRSGTGEKRPRPAVWRAARRTATPG